MVQAGFPAIGTTPKVAIQDYLNSESYIDMLVESLLPKTPLITGGDYLFQQDNASCHVSCVSRSCFEAKSVKLLDWIARSPDLNPIQNLQSTLAREMYKNRTQYANKDELT